MQRTEESSLQTARLPPRRALLDSRRGSSPDFHMCESCRAMALVGGFSRRSAASPAPCIPTLLHSNLISGSQDLDVECRQNLKDDDLRPPESVFCDVIMTQGLRHGFEITHHADILLLSGADNHSNEIDVHRSKHERGRPCWKTTTSPTLFYSRAARTCPIVRATPGHAKQQIPTHLHVSHFKSAVIPGLSRCGRDKCLVGREIYIRVLFALIQTRATHISKLTPWCLSDTHYSIKERTLKKLTRVYSFTSDMLQKRWNHGRYAVRVKKLFTVNSLHLSYAMPSRPFTPRTPHPRSSHNHPSSPVLNFALRTQLRTPHSARWPLPKTAGRWTAAIFIGSGRRRGCDASQVSPLSVIPWLPPVRGVKVASTLARIHLANPITVRRGATANEHTADAPIYSGLRSLAYSTGKYPIGNPPTSGIVGRDWHMRISGVTRPEIEPGSPWWEASSLTTTPPRLLVPLASWEWRWLVCKHARVREVIHEAGGLIGPDTRCLPSSRQKAHSAAGKGAWHIARGDKQQLYGDDFTAHSLCVCARRSLSFQPRPVAENRVCNKGDTATHIKCAIASNARSTMHGYHLLPCIPQWPRKRTSTNRIPDSLLAARIHGHGRVGRCPEFLRVYPYVIRVHMRLIVDCVTCSAYVMRIRLRVIVEGAYNPAVFSSHCHFGITGVIGSRVLSLTTILLAHVTSGTPTARNNVPYWLVVGQRDGELILTHSSVLYRVKGFTAKLHSSWSQVHHFTTFYSHLLSAKIFTSLLDSNILCTCSLPLATARLPPRRSGFKPRPGHSGFSHVGIVPTDAVVRRVFSGFSCSPPSPFNSGAAPYSPQSPSSALKTTLLRTVKISSLTHITFAPRRLPSYEETKRFPGMIDFNTLQAYKQFSFPHWRRAYNRVFLYTEVKALHGKSCLRSTCMRCVYSSAICTTNIAMNPGHLTDASAFVQRPRRYRAQSVPRGEEARLVTGRLESAEIRAVEVSRADAGEVREIPKPTDQHRPTRYPRPKIRERPHRESNPVRIATRANRFRCLAESSRIFACRNRAGQCRWSAGFLGDLPFSPAFISSPDLGYSVTRSCRERNPGSAGRCGRCTSCPCGGSRGLEAAVPVGDRPLRRCCLLEPAIWRSQADAAVVASRPTTCRTHWLSLSCVQLLHRVVGITEARPLRTAIKLVGKMASPASNIAVREPVWNLLRKIGRVQLPNLVRNLPVQGGKCNDGCRTSPYTGHYGGPCTSFHGIWYPNLMKFFLYTGKLRPRCTARTNRKVFRKRGRGKGTVDDRSPEQPAGDPTRRSGRRVPGEAMASATPNPLPSETHVPFLHSRTFSFLPQLSFSIQESIYYHSEYLNRHQHESDLNLPLWAQGCVGAFLPTSLAEGISKGKREFLNIETQSLGPSDLKESTGLPPGATNMIAHDSSLAWECLPPQTELTLLFDPATRNEATRMRMPLNIAGHQEPFINTPVERSVDKFDSRRSRRGENSKQLATVDGITQLFTDT
ncbi:hypothetical protein PR048_030723 [Dryococelus australis]|uniref:Uncharacterized protein n=1 Tax=Dryococelus australis TaxID=614101 RepID=A0ABQ9G9Q0_9NEOP|nr:hypothetical protein PR048_030723 [Dryococelus australis]